MALTFPCCLCCEERPHYGKKKSGNLHNQPCFIHQKELLKEYRDQPTSNYHGVAESKIINTISGEQFALAGQFSYDHLLDYARVIKENEKKNK